MLILKMRHLRLHLTNKKKYKFLVIFIKVFSPLNQAEIFRYCQTKEILHQMLTLEITEEKVSKVLNKLKPDKTPGPDGHHPKFFKNLANSLCKPLCLIFRYSLTTNSLPDIWKTARITAIFKKGNKNSKQLPSSLPHIHNMQSYGNSY